VNATSQNLANCCANLYELPIVEQLLGQSFHPGGARLTRQLASASLISPRSEVLDVACGNGYSARVIAAGFGAAVTGCDYSALNLERAITASQAAGLAGKTQFVRASAERLPFAPESFDVSLCECSLCLFENMDVALQQLRSVLKPGGRIGLSDFFLNTAVPDSLSGLLGRVLCVAGAPSADGYREALSRAGFDFIRIRKVNWTLADMIQRIRHRFKLLTATKSMASADIPVDFGDPAAVLKDLEEFIAGDGAGYLIATARRT
jgi:ubiquinone/menaquinone biosynthesis C-methylase UbiE